MNIWATRICIGLSAAAVLLSKSHYLLVYILVFWSSLEYLNSRSRYRADARHRAYNGIFALFVLFVALNRSRPFMMDARSEYAINLVEHGLFALVICLNLICYLELFTRLSERSRLLLVMISFNVIGIVNEIYQNHVNDRDTFTFLADAQKDIAMNAVGSAVFLILVRRMDRQKVIGREN